MFPGQCYDCDSYACTGCPRLDPLGIGLEPAIVSNDQPFCPKTPAGSEDNEKPVPPPIGCIGSSSLRSQSPKDLQESGESYVDATGSPVNLRRRNAMCGRRTLECPILSLSSEVDPCEETHQQIGMRYDMRLKEAILESSPQTFIFGK